MVFFSGAAVPKCSFDFTLWSYLTIVHQRAVFENCSGEFDHLEEFGESIVPSFIRRTRPDFLNKAPPAKVC